MKYIILFLILLLPPYINSQTIDSTDIIISHFNDDGFMSLKFGDNIESTRNKLSSFDGIEFVKTINGGLLYRGGEIDGQMVETWEIFFANDQFAGLRISFIDTKLFSELTGLINNKYGKYSNRQENGPVIYIDSDEGNKLHDIILDWDLSGNEIELEQKIDGIGAFGTKVFLTYANMKLASQLNLN